MFGAIKQVPKRTLKMLEEKERVSYNTFNSVPKKLEKLSFWGFSLNHGKSIGLFTSRSNFKKDLYSQFTPIRTSLHWTLSVTEGRLVTSSSNYLELPNSTSPFSSKVHEISKSRIFGSDS